MYGKKRYIDMWKKFFMAAAVLALMTPCVQAQTYTIESQQGGNSSAPSVINNNSGRHAGNFCEAFGIGLTDTISGPSSINAATTPFLIGMDPYIIEIDGIKYMLIKDNNNGVYTKENILGLNDTIQNAFASLRPLDKNRDNKLTGAELSEANIRLVKIDLNGKLQLKDKKADFNNAKVKFIYMTELRKAYKNNGQIGDFGLFDVMITDKNGQNKLVTGILKFESDSEIEKYF